MLLAGVPWLISNRSSRYLAPTAILPKRVVVARAKILPPVGVPADNVQFEAHL
jgi:hypothetical protein